MLTNAQALMEFDNKDFWSLWKNNKKLCGVLT